MDGPKVNLEIVERKQNLPKLVKTGQPRIRSRKNLCRKFGTRNGNLFDTSSVGTDSAFRAVPRKSGFIDSACDGAFFWFPC